MMIASRALSSLYPAEAQAAYYDAQDYFGSLAKQAGVSLYEYAHRQVKENTPHHDGTYVNVEVHDNNRWDDHELNKVLYRARMTYGFAQDEKRAGLPPVVPEGAEVLLETRQPYLTSEQRRAILATTQVDSGYTILDQTNGWGRIDLVTAADGYGRFDGDVYVVMDANEGGFNAQDAWRNNISGQGMLTKAGTGHLILTGDNSYSGGSLLKAGTLEASSVNALGKGDVYIEKNGTLKVSSSGSLSLGGNLTIDKDAVVELLMDKDEQQIDVAGILYLDGGTLSLNFTDIAPEAGSSETLLLANTISGEFADVKSGDHKVRLEYTDTSVIAHIL